MLSNRWNDDELAAILYETQIWAVRGRHGMVLCTAASLHLALKRATEYAVSGAIVVAVTRSSPDILLFHAQMERLRKIIAGDVGIVDQPSVITRERSGEASVWCKPAPA
jgi:hypothetical protein